MLRSLQLILLLAVLAPLAAAPAASSSVQTFSLPSSEASFLAPGPDGNVWYLGEGLSRLGRVSPTGAVQEFTAPSGSVINGLTAGSDGNMWYSQSSGRVGRVTPTGAFTEFDVSPSGISGIALASDGNVWFSDVNQNRMGRVTPAGAVSYFPVPAGFEPYGAQRGNDGNIWFESRTNPARIERITPAGEVREFSPSGLDGLGAVTIQGAGPGGDMWVSIIRRDARTRELARVTSAGTFETILRGPPGYVPFAVSTAPDGNAWLAQTVPAGAPKAPVARVTPSGSYSAYCGRGIPATDRPPRDLTVGPDGAVWLSIQGTSAITRITIDTPADPQCQPPPPPKLGSTATVSPVSGRVLIRRKGSRRFVALGKAVTVPVGSELDTIRGRVSVTTATDTQGSTQTAAFYKGRFIVKQRRVAGGLTDITLSEPLSCQNGRTAASSARRARRVWGDGRGRFRTGGRGGAAAVRGTIWLTEDRCNGTFFRVRRGTVDIRDFAKKRTITLRAPRTYFARLK